MWCSYWNNQYQTHQALSHNLKTIYLLKVFFNFLFKPFKCLHLLLTRRDKTYHPHFILGEHILSQILRTIIVRLNLPPKSLTAYLITWCSWHHKYWAHNAMITDHTYYMPFMSLLCDVSIRLLSRFLPATYLLKCYKSHNLSNIIIKITLAKNIR